MSLAYVTSCVEMSVTYKGALKPHLDFILLQVHLFEPRTRRSISCGSPSSFTCVTVIILNYLFSRVQVAFPTLCLFSPYLGPYLAPI